MRFKSSEIIRSKYKNGFWRDAFLVFDLVKGQRIANAVARERGDWSAFQRLGYLNSGVNTKGEDGLHREVALRPLEETLPGAGFEKAAFYKHLWPVGIDVRSFDQDHTALGNLFKARVTKLFKQWVCGEKENRGFALRGPLERYGEDNDEFVSWYGDFRLVVNGTDAKHRKRRCGT